MENIAKQKIALFGGSFDPPHYGHAFVVNSLINSASFAEVRLVPSGMRPDKKNTANAEQRAKMLALFIQELFITSDIPVRIENCQIDGRLESSATIDLLDYLNSREPTKEFLFAIGADLIPQLPSWKNSGELLRRRPFILIPRIKPTDIDVSSPDFFQIEPADFSSSAIRKLRAGKKSISGLLPVSVEQYIVQEKIYLNYLPHGKNI